MSAAKAKLSPNLDLLRTVAVLCVFVSHLLFVFGVRSFGSLGHVGVILFFVHTSFVLMGSLERLQLDGGSNWQLVTGFWCRRFFRIYPLSILFVVLIAMFSIPAEPGAVYGWIGWRAFFSNLALTQNLTYDKNILGVLWTLPLEVQMYVMLPALYFVVRGRRRYLSLGLWAVSVVLALVIPAISERLNVFRLWAVLYVGNCGVRLDPEQEVAVGDAGVGVADRDCGCNFIVRPARQSAPWVEDPAGVVGVASGGGGLRERSRGLVWWVAACTALDRGALVWNLFEPYGCDGVCVLYAVRRADVGPHRGTCRGVDWCSGAAVWGS